MSKKEKLNNEQIKQKSDKNNKKTKKKSGSVDFKTTV